MRRLLIEIGDVGFMSGGETDFMIRIKTELITKKMIKDIITQLEEALNQEMI